MQTLWTFSNRQVFICRISTEKQRDLKTKNKRKKFYFLSSFIFFQGIFMRHLVSLYYSLPCLLQGSLSAFPDSAVKFQLSISISASWEMTLFSGSVLTYFKA